MSLLTTRSVLRVAGRDALKMLQGVTTNDVLKNDSSQYSLFLNPKGRVFVDALIHATTNDDEVLLDVDKTMRDRLVRLLESRILRSDVVLEEMDDLGVEIDLNDVANADPRSNLLGSRRVKALNDLSVIPDAVVQHTLKRYALGIPENAPETYGKVPLNLNADRLHGISWDKGGLFFSLSYA